MNTSGLPRIILGIVKNKNGEVLIIHRVKEEKSTGNVKLSWAFPGGGADCQNETKEHTVTRELLEETGYKVKMLSVISERSHPNFPVYIYYVACKLQHPDQVQQPGDPEVEKAIWVDPKQLKSYFTSDFDPKVANYLGL